MVKVHPLFNVPFCVFWNCVATMGLHFSVRPVGRTFLFYKIHSSAAAIQKANTEQVITACSVFVYCVLQRYYLQALMRLYRFQHMH